MCSTGVGVIQVWGRTDVGHTSMGSYRCGGRTSMRSYMCGGRTVGGRIVVGVVQLWGRTGAWEVYRCLQMGGWCLDTVGGSGKMGGSGRQGVGAATQMGGVGWQ